MSTATKPLKHRALVTLLALSVTLCMTPLAASANDDPNLDQQIDPKLSVVEGERVLDHGHVDLGPKFVAGEWRIMVHDDAAREDSSATSVWRYPEQSVVLLSDEAKLTIPQDSGYDFLGEAGKEVWVIPQTQNTEVVWLGWNTQDPEVMQQIDRGVTLTLEGLQGPGNATVYLQSGSFGEPEILWDSRTAGEQAIWVEVNTHTHANWVFDEPGIYLMRLRADATLITGEELSDTALIRVAVGPQATAEAALEASWQGEDAISSSDEAAQLDPDLEPDAVAEPFPLPLVLGAIVLAAIVLLIVVLLMVRRSKTNQQRGLAEPQHPEA